MINPILTLAFASMLMVNSWLFAPAANPATANSLIIAESPMHLAALPGLSGLFAGQRPANLGVKDGKLAPCPKSPNCVVSQGNADAEHAIDPIAYSGSEAEAIAKLRTIVESLPRTQVIEQTDTYLYAEFASQLMGFVDDVEFFVDSAAQAIQVRSASRIGESDLGVNRKRIEDIRRLFQA